MRPVASTLLFAGAFALHCGDDSPTDDALDAGSDAGTDSAQDTASGGTSGGDSATCPPKAQTCTEPCLDLKAWPVDLAANCHHPQKTIGCWTLWGVGGAITSCVQDPVDKVTYVTPSGSDSEYLIGTGQWTACPDGWTFPKDPCE